MTKSVLSIFGFLLLALGIIGFFNNPIFGLFAVDTTHNIVHIVTGVLSLIGTSGDLESSKMYAKSLGIFYVLLVIMGIFMPDKVLGVMTINTADIFLHLFFAAGFLYVGFTSARAEIVKIRS